MAALYVVAFHFFNCESHDGASVIVTTIDHGYIGVDLFFVLSGFVMAMSYKGLFDSKPTLSSMIIFLGRRFARIYPLYLSVSLVLICSILLHQSQRVPTESLVVVAAANLAMVQSWTFIQDLEGPMWSISTEWAAYLVFPLFLRVAFGSRFAAVSTFAICSLTLTVLAWHPAWAVNRTEANLHFGQLDLCGVPESMLARCFAEFAIGLLTFRLSKSRFGMSLSTNGGTGLILAIAIACLLTWRYSDLPLVACFALLIVSISSDKGILSRILGWRAVYLLGVWSYAIYLIHPLVRRLAWGIGAKLSPNLPLSNPEWVTLVWATELGGLTSDAG